MDTHAFPYTYQHKHQLNRTAHSANPWECMHPGCHADATEYTCTFRDGITDYHFNCKEHS